MASLVYERENCCDAALSTELQELTESRVILLSSYVTGVLHTTGISTAEVIMSTQDGFGSADPSSMQDSWHI